MTTSILITGVGGFIGYHVAREFLQAGFTVLGLDNFDPFYDRAIKEQNLGDLVAFANQVQGSFVFQELSLQDLSSERFAEHNPAGAIHLAAMAGVQPSFADPVGYLEANIRGTVQLLEYCHERKIAQLLFASSSSVYGENAPVPFAENFCCAHPISPYAATKQSCELFCYNYARLYGMATVALRFFSVYGPRLRPDLAIHTFTRLINAGDAIKLYGDGSSGRDYTYVTDIVAGVVGAWEWVQNVPPKTFEVFNLGSSTTTTLQELVNMIEASLGKKAIIEWKGERPGDLRLTHADISKSDKMLGYSPEVPIQEGIPRFVEWFVNQH